MLGETTFSESNKRIQLNLLRREKAVLFLDKRNCRNRKLFNKSEWEESLAELQEFTSTLLWLTAGMSAGKPADVGWMTVL